MVLKWFRRQNDLGVKMAFIPDTCMANLFANLPTNMPEELTETLATSQHVRIERIVSTGQSSPPGFWYDQQEHEWVAVLRGEAVLEFENEMRRLLPGDQILIPPHQKHRVALTSQHEPTVWLAVFY
jgi:cupin 2 domain-containing protein